MSSRVENMFGPRADWGKGNERVEAGRQKRPAAGKKAQAAHRRGAVREEAGNVPAARAKQQGSNKGMQVGMNGFVSVECGECGRVTNTCLREKRTIFNCKGCGHPTRLEGLANIHFKCACGFKAAYRTNRREKDIWMECLNCGKNVGLKRIRRGNYVPAVEVEV